MRLESNFLRNWRVEGFIQNIYKGLLALLKQT
jgi:hypothetical protein